MNGVTSAGPSVRVRGDRGRCFDCERGLGEPGLSHFSAALFVVGVRPGLTPFIPLLTGVVPESLSLAKTSNIPTPVVVFPARAIPSLSQSLRIDVRPARGLAGGGGPMACGLIEESRLLPPPCSVPLTVPLPAKPARLDRLGYRPPSARRRSFMVPPESSYSSNGLRFRFGLLLRFMPPPSPQPPSDAA